MNEDITKISIKDYLEGIGINTRKEGSRYFCSSPFSSDRNWSFCIYPTNTYFDFSTGHGGNIINLVARINNLSLSDAAKQLRAGIKFELYKPTYEQIKEEIVNTNEFDLTKYINKNPEEIQRIKAYAESRGITEGYECGVFFTRRNRFERALGNRTGVVSPWKIGITDSTGSGLDWVRNPALMFVHVDKNLKPCGAKFRRIDKQEPRFSARGILGFYLLETHPLVKSTLLYVVESESSANSLWSFLKSYGTVTQNYIVLSRGGVTSAPKLSDLPEDLQKLPIKLIIDYDGSEELYKERLKLYEDLKAEPIKLILPKGEDINFLYCRNEMWKIESLLL